MALTGVITGKNGTVKTGNSTYGSATEYPVRNWSLTESGGTLDTTDSGTGNQRSKVPQKRSTWSGSFEAIVDYGWTPLSVNTEYDAHFVLDDTGSDEVYYSGEIIITERGFSVPVEGEDIVIETFSFEVDGNMTKTDNSA